MDFRANLKTDNENIKIISTATYTDDGNNQMSHGTVFFLDSRYCNTYVRTMVLGGVATKPEYRRNGCVRRLFDYAFQQSDQEKAVVSILHPFSFSYYRKFGYEKISNHKVIEFPVSAIDYIPRYPDLVHYTSLDRLPDLLKIFEQFSENRNVMLKRFDASRFPVSSSETRLNTYLYYAKNGEPEGYITVKVEDVFSVNRMVGLYLHITELGFVHKEALMALLGFVRMYQGQVDNVKVHNCAMIPELDLVLKNYMHTKYTLIPDLAARVMDTKAILKANSYPAEPGRFTVEIIDSHPNAAGIFQVEYGNGQCAVVKKDSGTADLTLDMPGFTRMVYGCDTFTKASAAYLDHAVIRATSDDFFRAFPQRPCGLFEHV